MERVIFICLHNSARSQMAEGLLRTGYGDLYEVMSAGLSPGRVNPLAVRVMGEIGIDISAHRSKSVDEFIDREIDTVVTVCDQAQETCPFFPRGNKVVHKVFEDPSAATGTESEKLEVFRRVRDEIESWIEETFAVK